MKVNGAARSGSVPSATIKPPFLGIFSIASEQVCMLHFNDGLFKVFPV